MAPTKKLLLKGEQRKPAAMQIPKSLIEKGAREDTQQFVEETLRAERDKALSLLAAGAEPKVNSQTLQNLLGRRASAELFRKKAFGTRGLEGKPKQELDDLLSKKFETIARLIEKGRQLGVNTD
jgi:hypothetical protein